MTVQKECQMCKKLFVTRTAKSARWEKHCLDCYLKVKNTKTFQLKRYEEFEETKLKSIRIDIAKLQQEVDALPSIIKGELNNSLNELVDADFLQKTKKELHQDIVDFWNKKQEEDKAFKEKMQRQLLTLNNKILELMRR
tara:strand:+ start:1168 stop:1584 length:417 start_codon:yes stop_codon:yes gene_type:complete